MPKRRRKLGTFKHEFPEKVSIITNFRCAKQPRKMLQSALRLSRPRTTCRDIVVECAGTPGDRDARLRVRAICTNPKTREFFKDMVDSYSKAIADLLS